KLADLPSIVNQSGWKLIIGAVTYWSFTMSGSNVVIPVSDKYIFFDKTTNQPLDGGAVVAPGTVKGTYLSQYRRTSRANIVNEIHPDWWGANPDGLTDSTD